jgi:6-phospho-3-hexuloisomerase
MGIEATLQTNLKELAETLERVDASAAQRLGEAILEAERLFLAGLGRSGLVMRMFALRLMQLGLTTHVVGDATTPAIGPDDLLLVGSGSGETPGALAAATSAHEAGARVAAITARPRSTLIRLADVRLVIPGATPKANGEAGSRLPMASVLEQAFLIVTDGIVAELAAASGQTDEAMMARHANLE